MGDVLVFISKNHLYFIGSKCLTLLVEIHPINNVKVLKAVDGYIWVQVSERILYHLPHSSEGMEPTGNVFTKCFPMVTFNPQSNLVCGYG